MVIVCLINIAGLLASHDKDFRTACEGEEITLSTVYNYQQMLTVM